MSETLWPSGLADAEVGAARIAHSDSLVSPTDTLPNSRDWRERELEIEIEVELEVEIEVEVGVVEGCTPAPVSWTVIGQPAILPERDNVPVTQPATAGINVTLRFTDWPGARAKGRVGPA